MTEKEEFIESLKQRIKQFAVDVILFCRSLKSGRSSNVIEYQLVKAATSGGANYRSACRARSKPEFYSKICIVVEEVDETEYWLEIIDMANLSSDKEELIRFRKEANELLKIMTKAKTTSYRRNNK